MNVAQTVAEVLRDHVVLEYESIDRMYLNVYVPQLQRVDGVVGYLHATHCYRLTQMGLKTAMFYTRTYNRILRPGLALLSPKAADTHTPLRRRFAAINDAINAWTDQEKLAA